MTKILFFITPTSLVKLTSKIGSKAAGFVPVLGPTLKFTKKAEKVTKLTNPVAAGSRGIGLLLEYCFGKVGAASIECVLWVSLSTLGGLTANPILIGAGAEFGSMVIDEIVD
jgi:hypothetical protein